VKSNFRFFFIFFSAIILVSCAKTGRPEGGPKDEEAPLFVTANPPYESIKFNKKEIKIEFNEFVKIKDLSKKLVVSPPLKNPALISPQGSATKFIKIEILDTLIKNTTYIFNFGDAIEDNNEANKLENFKYVFSTGPYIDSLKTSGTIKDAEAFKTPKNINILLYKMDSSFNDSIIYKKKPNYITSTLDTTLFKFTNLKKGKYLMLALQENSNDYIFNAKTDRIGFLRDTIQLPRDSIITKPIVLFRETQPYTFKRGKEVTRGKIEFGFEGVAKNIQIEILSKVPEDFKSISKFEIEKDTLNYWFTPIEADSLNFIVKNNTFLDTVTVKLRKNKIDSLTINPSIKGVLHLRDTFFINTNNPIIKIDTTKITLVKKDTIAVKFKTLLSNKENKIGFVFTKEPKEKYRFNFLPESFTDIYNIKNDTLDFRITTKDLDDYGRITLNVNNVNSKNLIIEILSGKDQKTLVDRTFINTSKKLIFDLLEPSDYTIRAIIDDNKNNKWDTGSFLQRISPEKIIYHENINNANLRANYFLEESFIID
jgi:uncharacterized protein (DUF2141 family)